MALKTWVVVINLIVDVLVVITIPIYLIFLKHLISNKKKSDSIRGNGFALIMFANGFWDIMNSLMTLFFVEIPRYGIWSDFYDTPDPWKARICKSVILGSQIFQMISASAIAINRWYAINRPVAYNSVFSPKNMRVLYLVLYILTVIYMLPLLFVAQTATYHYEDEGIYYGFADAMFVLIYGLTYTVFSLITAIVWVIVYSQISVYITNNLQKAFRQNQVKKTVAKVTAASFLFTLGTIFTFLINMSSDVAWRFFGIENLYDIDLYFCLTRVGQELANLSTPWVMIAFFPEMRNGMLQQMRCMGEKNRVFQADGATHTAVRSSTGPSFSTVPMRNIAVVGLGGNRQQMQTISSNNNMSSTIRVG